MRGRNDLLGRFVCHQWCSRRNSIPLWMMLTVFVVSVDSILGEWTRVDDELPGQSCMVRLATFCTGVRSVFVIHDTFPHSLFHQTITVRVRKEWANMWLAVCVCLLDVCVKRAMEAACDYTSLISHSKQESARLSCIMTNFRQSLKYWDINVV